MVKKIISGGNTGSDLGGLLAAERFGLVTGGTAPKGFKTEAGRQSLLSSRFFLVESKSENYYARTRENVIDACATIILSKKRNSTGTRQTIRCCVELQKPYILINPFAIDAANDIFLFLKNNEVEILNVAGNRESIAPGITKQVASMVMKALRLLHNSGNEAVPKVTDQQ